MTDDAELLRRYAEDRSENAFAELVRRHLNLVYFAALRRVGGDTHLAEDITQCVFRALACKATSLRQHPVLTGWLYTTTRNVASQALRSQRRREKQEQEVHIMSEISAASEPEANWEQLRPVIDAALDELSERDREAVLLRFFSGRSFAEIGEKLELSENAARMRVDRALDKLRALLAKRRITSTVAALNALLSNEASAATPAGLAASVTNGVLAAGIAGTAASATAGMSFFAFMSSTKITLSLAAILALLAVSATTREINARSATEASLAIANRAYDVRLAELRGLGKRVLATEQESVRLKQSVAEARAAQAAVKAAAAQSKWDPKAEGKAFLVRHPEVERAWMEWGDARINFQYGALFKSLGLTPDQIQQLRWLIDQRKWLWYLVGATREGTGVFPGRTGTVD